MIISSINALNQDLNAITNLYKENHMNFKVVELNTNSSLAGSPAYTIVYTYNDQGTNTRVREIGTLINNSKEYYITYDSEEETYPNNLLTSEMIKSYEIPKLVEIVIRYNAKRIKFGDPQLTFLSLSI
jgi:hypothetical protein